VETMSRISLRSELLKKIDEFDKQDISFINRAQELSLLFHSTMPVIVVSGHWGQGKTKLAYKLTKELSKNEDVLYIAYRIMDNIYPNEFITHIPSNVYKKYYESKGISSDYSLPLKYILPLIRYPIRFSEIYNAGLGKGLIVHVKESSLEDTEHEKTSDISTLFKGFSKVKTRYTIIFDEFEELIKVIVENSGLDAAKRFIDEMFNVFRVAHDVGSPIRLIVFTVPRTLTVDIGVYMRETTAAWAGKSLLTRIEKLSIENLVEYGDRLISYILGFDISLNKLLNSSDFEVVKRYLDAIPTTRFAVEAIKQLLLNGLLDISQAYNVHEYGKLKDLILNRGVKISSFTVKDAVMLEEPSHTDIITNYRKVLESVKKKLIEEYKIMATGPAIISMARGYESYSLTIGKGTKTLKLIFWIRPSRYFGGGTLLIDNIMSKLRLEDTRKMKMNTYIYIVTFQLSRYLDLIHDMLTSAGFHADVKIHSPMLKYYLSGKQYKDFLEKTIKECFEEEVKDLARDIMYVYSLLV
jgi:hypothetical protein